MMCCERETSGHKFWLFIYSMTVNKLECFTLWNITTLALQACQTEWSFEGFTVFLHKCNKFIIIFLLFIFIFFNLWVRNKLECVSLSSISSLLKCLLVKLGPNSEALWVDYWSYPHSLDWAGKFFWDKHSSLLTNIRKL